MGVISQLKLGGEDAGNLIRTTWDTLSGVPGGKVLFSKLIGRMARYTGTVGATVTELEQGRSMVELRDRPIVRNHLKCIHAIALANLGELAGNVALAYSMPPDARFIVAGLRMEYLKKARGTIYAEGRSPAIDSSAKQNHEVVVTMRDGKGNVVARCTLDTLVGPK